MTFLGEQKRVSPIDTMYCMWYVVYTLIPYTKFCPGPLTPCYKYFQNIFKFIFYLIFLSEAWLEIRRAVIGCLSQVAEFL